MALQFACIVDMPRTGSSTVDKGKGRGTGKGKKSKVGGARGDDEGGANIKGGSASVVLEAVTRRESSLALFHLMGKVLYNKRESPFLRPSHSRLCP
jgi:cell cycle checkpoint protein